MNAGSGRGLRSTGLGDRLLGATLGLSVLFNHRVLVETLGGGAPGGPSLDEALYDPGVSSPILGLAVFVALVFARRREIGAAIGAPPWLGGALAWLGLGTALRGWSHVIGADDLVMPAFILELIGAAALLGGRPLVAVLGFPALALVCVVPLPAILINELLFPLQLGTAALASFLLDVLGEPHLVAGDLILAKGSAFQVIEGCSGLKTILSLLLAAVAYAELVVRRGFEKLVILALAPAIGFLVNGLRVLVLVLRKVPAESPEHDLHGVAAVVLGVVLLAAVELLLTRTLFHRQAGSGDVAEGADGRRSSDPVHGEPAAAVAPATERIGSGRLRGRLVALTAWSLVASAFVAGTSTPILTRQGTRAINIEELPLELAGREARGLRIDDGLLGRVRFRHRLYRAYEKDNEPAVRVFVGLAEEESRAFSSISPKTAIPHSGWLELEWLDHARTRDIERERLRLRYDPTLTGDRSLDAAPSEPVRRGRPPSGGVEGSVLVEHVQLGFAPWEVELLRAWLGLDLFRPSASPPRLVIRVEADLSGDRAESELRLRQFTQEVVDWYRNAG